MLRTGELLKVTPGHVVWGSKSSTLLLPHTEIGQRTGELQSVSLTDKVVLKLLRAVCRNRHSPAPFFQGSGRTFRTMFQACVHGCKLSHLHLQPYGLRRGGVSEHFERFQSLDSTM
eukprot:5744216-Amphidinium_carterae.1